MTKTILVIVLQGLVTLVSGGASGLGRATAARLVKAGGRVAIADLKGSDGAAVAKELGEERDVIFTPVDVREENDVMEALKKIKKEFGRLDNIVNCAGIGIAFKTYNFNKDRPHQIGDFQRVMDVRYSPLLPFIGSTSFALTPSAGSRRFGSPPLSLRASHFVLENQCWFHNCTLLVVSSLSTGATEGLQIDVHMKSIDRILCVR